MMGSTGILNSGSPGPTQVKAKGATEGEKRKASEYLYDSVGMAEVQNSTGPVQGHGRLHSIFLSLCTVPCLHGVLNAEEEKGIFNSFQKLTPKQPNNSHVLGVQQLP